MESSDTGWITVQQSPINFHRQERPGLHCTALWSKKITFKVLISWPLCVAVVSQAGMHCLRNNKTWLKALNYNLGQNCWENCILGQYFSKHRSCTGSSLSPFPWKQCCCVFKRKPDPWAFVGSNIELGEGVFFPQRRRFGNSFVA